MALVGKSVLGREEKEDRGCGEVEMGVDVVWNGKWMKRMVRKLMIVRCIR